MTHAASQLIRPLYLPEAGLGDRLGWLVLNDGSRLRLRTAGSPFGMRGVLDILQQLEADECAEVEGSFGSSLRPDENQPDDSNPVDHGFLALDGDGEDAAAIAFAAFRRIDPDHAAVTLAVLPSHRQRGLATLLLERLMVLAAQSGVEQLEGLAHRGNTALGEVFRRGGFVSASDPDGEHLRFTFATRQARGDDELAARVYAAASLHALFHPRSVAVVGASRDPESVGFRILDALVRGGFQGPVFPVNPKAAFVGSIRAYPNLEAIGPPVDLVVVSVPARLVEQVVVEAAACGARGLVVITAGFAEVGDRDAQTRVLDLVRRHGMRMVGPNCLGLMQTDLAVRLNASFAPTMPEVGPVALGSQSGALGIAIIALARRLGLGMSSFVSMGNKADVSGNDLLEYWEEDPRTRVVLFYLESFGNPRRFARIARRVGRAKPIVVVKAGRTQAGSRAASSHTAALTAADTAVEALFRQTGILRADTLQEMFDTARALVTQPLPPGRRVAVVTNAGGPGILCADALEAAGMVVAPLEESTQTTLRAFLPAAASASNPVDMIATADPATYRQAVETVLTASEVDALVVIYTPTGIHSVAEINRAVAEAVAAARGRSGAEASGAGKPVFASIVGDEVDTFRLDVPASGPDPGEVIPVYAFPEEIGRTLGKIAAYAEWRRADPGLYPEFPDQQLAAARDLCQQSLKQDGEGWLASQTALDVLRHAGLQVAESAVATTADEAAELAERLGLPVAVKLASRKIVHKTEHGGVILGVTSGDAARRAFESIAADLEAAGLLGDMDGVLIQPMVEGSCELMVGMQHDPIFGPLLAFGLGGIHVEILRDVEFRVAPLSDRDADEMIRGIRGYRLLEGYRGHAAADVEALRDALLRLSRLVEAVPEIAELDLNPLFALEPGRGYRIVDARLRVDQP